MSLTSALSFSDLSITNNSDNTATSIALATNNNQILAIVLNVDATDITADDFITI